MDKKELVILTDEIGVWEVAYFNDKNIVQGHSIRLDELLEFFVKNKIIDNVVYKTFNTEKYDDENNPEFHENLKDYKEDDFQN